MMWQDLVFLAGNVFSIIVLTPTLKDETANVPLETSLPSLVIGLVYGTAFLTMGMTYSAVGAVLTGVIWGFIALLRSSTDISELVASARRDSEPSPSALPPRAD